MSGGSLNYFYCTLQEHVGDFGDAELDDLVNDLAELFHDREWYLSADTGEGDWNEAREAFKAKWFTQHGRQERIEQQLSKLTEEIRRSYGISNKYCINCKNWTVDKRNKDKRYGTCGASGSRCLYHRYEHCEKWEGKTESDEKP